MADSKLGFLEQIQTIWNRLTTGQKVSLAALAAAVVVGLALLVNFMNSPDYQLLYSSLSSEDANSVVAKLKEKKIPYKLGDGGTSIRIPVEKMDEVRLQLASEGLPQSGKIGFEIFDKTNFGMTDFTNQVNYRRALEGELERTIRSLSEVAQARVHIVVPKESIFTERTEGAKASVLIRLKSGRQLSPASIAGIMNLIASGVEGLKPENVSVIDASGKVLSPTVKNATAAHTLSASELELQHSIEKEMTSKILSILEPAVGKGKVLADASVQLDSNSSELTEEIYNPNGSVILSQQKSEEKLLGASNLSGIPGTRSNQAGAAPPTASALPPDTRIKQSETVNYEVSKTVRHTLIPKGSIKKLSVAVLVDNKTVQKQNERGEVLTTSVARTPEEVQRIKDLVIAAIGYNKDRGDVVSVENVSFESPVLEQKSQLSSLEKLADYAKALYPIIRPLGVLILLPLLYFGLIKWTRRKITATFDRIRTEPSLAPGTPPALERSMERMLTEATRGEPTPDDPKMAELEEFFKGPSDEAKRMMVVKKRVLDLTKKDPQAASQLIRTWLQEERKTS